MMATQNDFAGITNALVGDCSLAEAIHADRLSSAHIMPQGNADPSEAMSHFNRLPDIVQALVQVYDIVVVECGPADSSGIERLLHGRDVELILSVVHPGNQVMTDCLTDFYAHGYDNIVLMSPGAPKPPENSGRSAA
jgi:Mrp family chromosome partitioning ATPase